METNTALQIFERIETAFLKLPNSNRELVNNSLSEDYIYTHTMTTNKTGLTSAKMEYTHEEDKDVVKQETVINLEYTQNDCRQSLFAENRQGEITIKINRSTIYSEQMEKVDVLAAKDFVGQYLRAFAEARN